jgi:hypothetical protein
MKAKQQRLQLNNDLRVYEFVNAEIFVKPLGSQTEASSYKIDKSFTNIAYLENLAGVYFFHQNDKLTLYTLKFKTGELKEIKLDIIVIALLDKGYYFQF